MSKVCYVSAFLDIGRDTWQNFTRDVSAYFTAFLPYITMFKNISPNLIDKYQMIVYIDSRHIRTLEKLVGDTKGFTLVSIDEEFLAKNIHAWSGLARETDIMNSSEYKDAFPGRMGYPEHTVPKYTLINHSKIDFINHAMTLTDAGYFCWSDFGYFKLPQNVPENPLDINKIDKDKINYTILNEITEVDKDVFYTITNAPQKICGYFFAGSREILQEYQKLYHDVLKWFQDSNLADDDQHIALQCYFRRPEMFKLHPMKDWHQALTTFQLDKAPIPANVPTLNAPSKTNKYLELLHKLDKYARKSIGPETLTTIMNRYGSDKGSGWHNYTEFYASLFDSIRDKKLNVLEIGIGTMNPSVPSNMCGKPGGYLPGSSIRGWKEYFPNAQVFGCDIDKDILFSEDRIATFHLDQTSSQSIKEAILDVDRVYDIIIDDGLHHFPTNWAVLKQAYPKLNKDGGIYIIEDIMGYTGVESDIFLKDKNIRLEYHQIPNNQNPFDNNLLVLKNL